MRSKLWVTVFIGILCAVTAAGASAANLYGVVASDEKVAERSIQMEELMRIAVRYFYPHYVKDKLHMHICVGINGLKDYPGAIDNQVKDFCIQSIHNAMRAGKTDIHKQAYALVQDAKKVKLSGDRQTEIHRIQGAVWVQLMKNEDLRRLLREAYAAQKDSLPFRLELPESDPQP